jgi:hypothetical protein
MATNNQVNTGLSGSTGTGTFVGSTSPTIVTPRIGQINDTNGNAMLHLIPTASAVNYFNFTNNAAGGSVFMVADGTDTDIALVLTAKGSQVVAIQGANGSVSPVVIYNGTGLQHATTLSFSNTAASRTVTFPDATGTLLMTGQAISTVPSIAFSSTSGVIGTTTNDNAASGSVGEFVSSIVADNTVSLTTATNTDATSISLTAGDWDVWGNVSLNGNGSTVVTTTLGWISSTSATLPASNIYATQLYAVAGALVYSVSPQSFCVPSRRFSLSGTTTIYLSARSVFTTSTSTLGGAIYARRVR